jgi:hypothetical protein
LHGHRHGEAAARRGLCTACRRRHDAYGHAEIGPSKL